MPIQTVFSRRNNTLIAVRPVAVSDAAAMQRFVTGLGQASRRWRFHGCVNGCAESFLRHLTDVDGLQHVAFVAYAGDELVGEARYFRDAQGEAEFAIAVADAYQRRGVAGLLMQALLRAARRAGITHLYGDVLDGNEKMAAFMTRQGFEIDLSRWDQVDTGIVRYQRAVRPTLRQLLPSFAGLQRPVLPQWSKAKWSMRFARRDVAI